MATSRTLTSSYRQGSANAPSWALNGSPFDDDTNDDQNTASNAFDSGLDFEEKDQFNPNGLGHGGHKRTYSFNGPKSPIRTPAKQSFKGHLRQGSGYALSPVSAAFPEHILEHNHENQTPPRTHSHSYSTHSYHSHGHSHDHGHDHSHNHSHGHSHSSDSHSHDHSHAHVHAPPTAVSSIASAASVSRFDTSSQNS